MYSVVERMDDCEYSLEIIIVPLKECIAEKNVFFNIQLLKKLLKQWMGATLSVTKTDILLQRKDGRN